ncbi:histone family protein nucleoid-structuring protein H-NS [Caballeronia calidae]|uniref:Histone family protein nucleoid-structuring protein H-NS n=1 Tax=Caballeronia calidae TaxID=1777139 RepID=A0A158E0G2_9BURK|nr:H-NS family nucleoid-associated regulatory protein [Caballeronia calidae]SAL00359.1 histone family protein nucleoid-structuring protein H-NS [Caballeronia calidae]
MATLESIEAKIAKLQSQADAITKKQSTKVIAEIHALMSEHGITIDDLGSGSVGKKAGTKMTGKSSSDKTASNAKFRDPKSGATWSGHGRAPGWIASAKNRDRFLIDGSLTSTDGATKNAAKPGNYVRGPQPALYRDPKSGATWSGRGRAPSWIASAKTRDRFLIDGSATTTPTADKTSAKPAGNYPRGPQPAKYRDSKSGATWSGRGKAPAWLAGVRDRTKFLINGAAETAADGKESAPKAVTAKKAAPKKPTATVSAKKGAAKKASTTSAKTAAGKSATTKKSAPAAKKGPQTGSRKAVTKKVAAKKSGGEAAAEKAVDSTALLSASGSDVGADSSAAWKAVGE